MPKNNTKLNLPLMVKKTPKTKASTEVNHKANYWIKMLVKVNSNRNKKKKKGKPDSNQLIRIKKEDQLQNNSMHLPKNCNPQFHLIKRALSRLLQKMMIQKVNCSKRMVVLNNNNSKTQNNSNHNSNKKEENNKSKMLDNHKYLNQRKDIDSKRKY